MESRANEAVRKKQSGGYNCAQAVACTYCDLVNVSEEEMRNITQGFAIGMGTFEGTCGAIIGANIIIGMYNKNHRKTFVDVKKLMMEFKEKNMSVTCKDLKGFETGTMLRSCDGCVLDACLMLENILFNK